MRFLFEVLALSLGILFTVGCIAWCNRRTRVALNVIPPNDVMAHEPSHDCVCGPYEVKDRRVGVLYVHTLLALGGPGNLKGGK